MIIIPAELKENITTQESSHIQSIRNRCDAEFEKQLSMLKQELEDKYQMDVQIFKERAIKLHEEIYKKLVIEKQNQKYPDNIIINVTNQGDHPTNPS